MDDLHASWEKFLDPEKLKRNLVAGAVFLAAYEMLKDALIDQLRGFFFHSWSAEAGWEISEKYRSNVLALDKKEMVACGKWFQGVGAIDADDLKMLQVIAEHRNVVAHELPSILGTSGKDVSLNHLQAIYALTCKIDKWWLSEIEAPINPDFKRTLTEEELKQSFSARMLVMSLLIEVGLGNDERLSSIYAGWKEHFAKAKTAS